MSDLIKRLRFASPCPDSLMAQAADALEHLETALKQAYIDAGCREDEAIEMVRSIHND